MLQVVVELLPALLQGAFFLFNEHLVAHDVLQVAVAHHVIFAHKACGVLYDLVGQTAFARYLDGKRTAGVAYAQLVERLHLFAVVEHGAALGGIVLLSVVFEVLVVGGDDAVCAVAHKGVQHALGQCTTHLRLRAAPEFVDEYQAAAARLFQHLRHAE